MWSIMYVVKSIFTVSLILFRADRIRLQKLGDITLPKYRAAVK